ncbi:MAG: hypothetical protein ACRDHO_01515 [Actinomycetota bacterium]
MIGEGIASQRRERLRREAELWRIRAALRGRGRGLAQRRSRATDASPVSVETALPPAERRLTPPGDLPADTLAEPELRRIA